MFAPLVLAAAAAYSLLPSAVAQATCNDIEIDVHVTKTVPDTFSAEPYTEQVLYALATNNILVTNNYTLTARLCMPSPDVPAARNDTIQLLLHGATFNKVMWDFPYQPERYSWERKMHAQGFPTLAVDLLGSGNSSRPHGLLECHTETLVATAHDVIRQLRAGEIDGNQWSRVIGVGFSIGGIVTNSLASRYPQDLNAAVLIGISWTQSWMYPAFISGLQQSASVIDPDRWGDISPMYQTQADRDTRRVANFYGDYDRDLLETDWLTRDFDSVGLAMTYAFYLVKAPTFNGPVFLGIGENDSSFCGGAKCKGAPYGVYDQFPNAASHQIHVYPNTGHAVLYHHAGQQLINDAISWLHSVGY